MAESYSPSVRLRRIARTLRNWREHRGVKGADIAARAGWSPAKQSRIETAAQPITPAEVMTLALIYGVDERERDATFNACLAAQQKGWWEAVGKGALAGDVLTYVELEAEASTVRTFKIDLVPGLLQTADYAAALGRAALPRASEEILQSGVEARTQRQARLVDDNPIHVEAVLIEGALHAEIGGPEVMRRQLERLVELAALPNIDLRVIPARAGAYPAMGTPFSLLSFAGGDPDVGYVELLDKGVYLEEADDVEPYRMNFAGLHGVALNPDQSIELIALSAANLKR